MAQPAAAPPATADHLKPLAFLADACWEGPLPDGTVDVHCYRWFMRGAYLRERHEVRGTQPPHGGECTFYWDHDAKAIRYVYWTNTGGMATGTMVPDGDGLRFSDERYVDANGEQRFRGTYTRVDADRYRMRTEVQDTSGAWIPMFDVTYLRKPINWGP
ncbi:MAG: hypothetical protein SFV21_10425 [Rhodospirillaceae bacterium]|nr:hypothetical protein [Rhodospirillaceae bacterium]